MRFLFIVALVVAAYYYRDQLSELLGLESPGPGQPPQAPEPKPVNFTAQDLDFFQEGPVAEAFAVQPHYENVEVYDVSPLKPRMGTVIDCGPGCSTPIDYVQHHAAY